MLTKIVIKNYRCYEDFTLEFNKGLNILVGDNDSGKSTLLEAIGLALTGRHCTHNNAPVVTASGHDGGTPRLTRGQANCRSSKRGPCGAGPRFVAGREGGRAAPRRL